MTKRGFRYHKRRKKVQKYGCKNCKKKFSEPSVDFGMKNKKEVINKAIELRKKGLSYAQIQKEIKIVSRQTICRWVKKYCKDFIKVKAIVKIKNQFKSYKREFEIKVPTADFNLLKGGIREDEKNRKPKNSY